MPPSADVELALALIDEPPHQLRESIDPAALGELADDIGANGLLNAINVRGPFPNGRYEVAAGHRRLLAHQLLARDTIRCHVHPTTADPLMIAAAENLQRADMTPVEEARTLAKFLARGTPQAALPRLFRRSADWVDKRLALLHYPDDVQQAVQAKRLTLGVAAALAEVDHDDYRASLIDEAASNGATRAVVEVWLAHFRADRARIIQNQTTVQEIVEGRRAFVVYAPCEMCRQEKPIEETRQWRVCPACHGALVEAVRSQAATP